eukprot:711742-Pelagomonas_calceolata.AAC.1
MFIVEIKYCKGTGPIISFRPHRYIGNLQPESQPVADCLLVNHFQPAFTSVTASKQDKFLRVFVPSTHWRTLGT